MKTILMCYEEGPVTARVVERTALIAKTFEARVLVTSVAPVLHGRGGPIDATDPPSRHEAEVEDAVARLAELGVTGSESVIGIGDPAKAIVTLADERNVDLIVVGAHEGGIISRLIEGNVSGTVARKAHADVLIVH
jgi:nucleotide-binding universal stress UspA family protein